MRCPNCGENLSEEKRFCTRCGRQLLLPIANDVLADNRSSKVNKKTIAISAGVAAVVATGIGVAFYIVGVNNAGDDKLPENVVSSVAQNQVMPNEAETSDVTSNVMVENVKNENGTSLNDNIDSVATDDQNNVPTKQEVKLPALLDINQKESRSTVNLFLSNFTEIWGAYKTFDITSSPASDAAMFAVLHCGKNSPSDWEYARNSEQQYSQVPGEGGGANGRYNVRIAASRASEIAKRYFGRDLDYDALSGLYRGEFHYWDDGYIYFGTTNGTGAPDGVAYATKVEDIDNGEYRITFDIYSPPDHYYDVADGSLYSASAEELQAKFGVSKPYGSGTAVVKIGEYNEYTKGLVLISYSSQQR